jgi:hypothetical protein
VAVFALMRDASQSKRSAPLAALSFLIGIAALIAFIALNRMMAPPFPKFATYPSASHTNAPGTVQLTNNASATNK